GQALFFEEFLVQVPAGSGVYEFTTKRSRFIGTAQRADSREAVDAIVDAVQGDHPDAGHIVYAFVIGDERNELLGMSDDGEPHGTAGRPVLEVLKGSGIRNCLITVVRYFGGTKLGTGGLVHAYGDAAKGCIADLSVAVQRDRVGGVIQCPYELHESVLRLLRDYEVEVTSEEFGTGITIACLVERGGEAVLQERLHDVSRGTLKLDVE
ncbi:MAG TPA: YigZ family protein, partial [Alkalispirochaeta sp.]|nr:YigZ family protein [Alkalispirochaeta sp.]